MLAQVNPGFLSLPAYVPGAQTLGTGCTAGGSTVKLSSNENPLGPSPRAAAAVAAGIEGMGEYPDDRSEQLRAALATHLGVPPTQVLMGNGSTELISLIARVFLTPGDALLLAPPAFLAYERAAAAMNAAVVRVPPTPSLAPDLGGLMDRAGAPSKLLFLGNPTNPTGAWVESGPLQDFLASLPPQLMVVVDEAYHEYATGSAGYASVVPLVARLPRLLVLRSFSKAFGLAGLRLGFVVGSEEVIELLGRAREPFNVSQLAQCAGPEALADLQHIDRSVAANALQRRRLSAALSERGFAVWPSAGNFVLADMKRPTALVFRDLAEQGVVVRPMQPYHLPSHQRITVGTQRQVDRLLAALDRLDFRG